MDTNDENVIGIGVANAIGFNPRAAAPLESLDVFLFDDGSEILFDDGSEINIK